MAEAVLILSAGYGGAMRLGTFNVMHGRSLTDGLVVPERFGDSIGALDADVLGLQEVDRGQPRSGYADLARIAAEALAAPYARFVPAVIGTPGETYRGATVAEMETAVLNDGVTLRSRTGVAGTAFPTIESTGTELSTIKFSPTGSSATTISGPAMSGAPGSAIAGPEYGVALISRWPVSEWRVAHLAGAPVRSPIYVPGPGGGLLLVEDEPRVLLAAVVQAPFGRVTVATTHLSFVPGWNLWQLRAAIRFLRQMPAPRVLLGDLNLPAAFADVASGWLRLARRPTYPAPAPRVQLDHVLVDRLDADRIPRAVAVETPSLAVSDHRPLLVRLDAVNRFEPGSGGRIGAPNQGIVRPGG